MAEMVKKATRESFGETVTALAAEYPEIVVLDADLAAATKTGIFKKAYPERFFDCGIAECNMVALLPVWPPAVKFRLRHPLPCSPQAERLSRSATPLVIRS